MIMRQIIEKDIKDLIPYCNNSRTHSDEQVQQIASSIKEFGFTNPVLIDEQGGIIAGHGRVMGAKKLLLNKVPCIVLDGLSEAQKKAYIIADNKLALNAGWDDELLKIELEQLKELDFALGLIGFSDDELALLIGVETTEGIVDEDQVPELVDDPVTVLGDVWILGNHRLMCGDSTSIDAVERLMNGKAADFCFTSPPYNAALTCAKMHSKCKSSGAGGLYRGGYSDNLSSDDYIKFNMDIISALDAVSCADFVCCYNINYNKNSPSEYIDVMHSAKGIIPLVETIVWEKSMAVSLHGDNLTRIYEFVFVLCKGAFKINKARTECLKNLWKISNIGANHDKHKACFPVALVEEGIKNFAPHGAVIIEPFGGSGTTMIAAEKLGCRSNLMELDPKYCDVIIKRWQDFTGKQATLEANGKTYNELLNDNQTKNKN